MTDIIVATSFFSITGTSLFIFLVHVWNERRSRRT